MTSPEFQQPQVRDFFAEMYVAGLLADRGWNVYFPRRDKGFDMIATRRIGDRFVLRPVQVKGKFPRTTRNKKVFGFIGRLTELHDDMVLVLPFFRSGERGAPKCIAWMPRSRIRPQRGRGHACRPASLVDGVPCARREFVRYFDEEGLKALEAASWG